MESSTGSDSSLNLAEQWLHDCSTKHKTCQASTTGFLPTRLIDIGLDSVPRPRISLGEHIAPGTRYLTLSHCWGRVVPKRLLKEDLGSMMASISYEELSKTFQDAILVTKRLGARYLWIDSLCIIQDCTEDWQRESASMGQIYANSLCNISATAARDGSQGLFFERNPLAVRQVRTQVTINGVKEWYCLYDTDLLRHNVNQAPLNLRAWVCQERFLAPCNLHFTSNQLFWECDEQWTCETFPEAIPKPLLENSIKQHLARNLKLPGGSSSSQVTDSLFMGEWECSDIWLNILYLYGRYALSQFSDKLIAVGGLAALTQRTTKHEYLAGLWWREDLPQQLLWYVPEIRSDPSDQYIAPSWSWASVDEIFHPVRLSPGRENSLIEIADAHIDFVSNNSFGQVKGGHLCIKCNFLTEVYEQPQGNDVGSAGRGSISMHNAKTVLDKADMSVFWDRNNLADTPGTLHLLLVIGYTLRQADSGEETLIRLGGLVLISLVGKVGNFRRCGSFITWFSNSVKRLLDDCRYFDSVAAESGLDYSSDGDGDLVYTITLY
jgi:hypothetical protein